MLIQNKHRLGMYLLPNKLHCALITYHGSKSIVENHHYCYSTNDPQQLKADLTCLQQHYAKHCRHGHCTISCEFANLQVINIDHQCSSKEVLQYIKHNSRQLFSHALDDLYYDCQIINSQQKQQHWLLTACKKSLLQETLLQLTPKSLILRSLQIDALTCSYNNTDKNHSESNYAIAYCHQTIFIFYILKKNRLVTFYRNNVSRNLDDLLQAVTQTIKTQAKLAETANTLSAVYLTGPNQELTSALFHHIKQTTAVTASTLHNKLAPSLLLPTINDTPQHSNASTEPHMIATLAALTETRRSCE